MGQYSHECYMARRLNDDRLEDPDWLYEKYVIENLDAYEIGDIIGCAHTTVLKRLREHDIRVQNASEYHTDGDTHPLRDEDWLREQYWNEGLSAVDIADKLGCGSTTVISWMDRHGIERRGLGEHIINESPSELQDEEWLRTHYIDMGMTTVEIGEKLDVMDGTVGDWLEHHGIERRSPGVREGEDNPRWLGGHPEYYGSQWPEKREEIRDRDGDVCQRCGDTMAELGIAPDVHHIIPVREFDDPNDAHTKENMIQLCKSCHRYVEELPTDEQIQYHPES